MTTSSQARIHAIDELLRRIAEEFRDVPRPGHCTKRVARALDDQWQISDARAEELYNQDHEAKWTGLTDVEIEEFNDILTFCDAEGFLFYLPAFMSVELRHNMEWEFGSHVIMTLAYPVGRFALFTTGQMACVMDFLTLKAATSNDDDSDWAAYAVDYIEHAADYRKA